MAKTEVLYSSETMSVTYYFKPDSGNKALSFIFSSLGSRTLHANANGGEFLLENGFDVINFNSNVDDWFQGVPSHIFPTIEAVCGPKAYERRVAMGSSMGGYAALCFSKPLKCDMVLVYAPQSFLANAHDPRFGSITQGIHWVYPVTEETISRTCKYWIIYDNKDEWDTNHARYIDSIVAPGNGFETLLPYAGHAVTFYLLELGLLKQTSLDVLAGKAIDVRELRKNRRASRQYISTLTNRLIEKGHFKTAAKVKALIKDNYTPPFLIRWAIAHPNRRISNFAENLEVRRLSKRGFDEQFYAHLNWDVVQTGLPPLLHYVRYGIHQQRIIRFRRS